MENITLIFIYLFIIYKNTSKLHIISISIMVDPNSSCPTLFIITDVHRLHSSLLHYHPVHHLYCVHATVHTPLSYMQI